MATASREMTWSKAALREGNRQMSIARKIRLLLLVPIAIALSGGSAGAFCLMNVNPWPAEAIPIPVFLNRSTADALCSSASCPSLDALSTTTRVVLDEFYDNAGSKLRFKFAGITDEAPDATIAGAIHIYGGPCSAPTNAITTVRSDSTGKVIGVRVRMCGSQDGNPLSWSSFPPPLDGTLSFHGTLSHELMHSVGFDHPDEFCGQNHKSVVKQFYAPDRHHLYPDDIDGIQARYGLREVKIPHTSRSLNGTEWDASGRPLPPLAIRALSRFSTCNGATTGAILLATFVDHETNRLQFIARGDAGDWVILPDGLSFLGISEYHAAIACKSRSEVLIAWLCGTNSATGGSAVCRANSSDGARSWGQLEVEAAGIDRTGNIGISAAYDPSSERYVLVWRNTSDEIVSKVVDDNAQIQSYQIQPGSGQFLRASDSVSISCAPTATAGSQNCLLAWSDTGWFRTLRWAHATVNMSGGDPRLELSEIRTMGFHVYGTPSVAFSGQTAFPWHLVFHQGGRTMYVFHKSAANDSVWRDQRGISVGRKIVNPALGSNVEHSEFGGDSDYANTFVTSNP